MQGAAGYGNLRHRFPSAALSASGSLGMISTGPNAQYPRCYVKLFLFHQTHLIEPLPTLAGKVNPAVFGVVGNSVQYVSISVT